MRFRGGIQMKPGGLQYADWNIGPSRVAGLADYAMQQLQAAGQELLSQAGADRDRIESRLNEEADILRSEILKWTDEALGPKTEAGAPLSTIGSGAKAAYENFINAWVATIANNIRSEMGALSPPSPGNPPPVARAEKAPMPEPPPAKRTGWRPAPEGFLGPAKALVQEYPTLIADLKNTFVAQAGDVANDIGVKKALEFLKSQLDSVKRAGELWEAGMKKTGGATLTAGAIRRVFGAARPLAAEDIISAYRDMRPASSQWQSNQDYAENAQRIATWFNALPLGTAYKTADGAPTEMFWNFVSKELNLGGVLPIAKKPLPPFEEWYAHLCDNVAPRWKKQCEDMHSKYTEAGRQYYELVRQHPEDPQYWNISGDPYDYFFEPYDAGAAEEPWDPTQYEQDLADRLNYKYGLPKSDAGASWTSSDMVKPIYDKANAWGDATGRDRRELINFVASLWQPGGGFMTDPLAAIDQWIAQQANVTEQEAGHTRQDAYERILPVIRDIVSRRFFDPFTGVDPKTPDLIAYLQRQAQDAIALILEPINDQDFERLLSDLARELKEKAEAFK